MSSNLDGSWQLHYTQQKWLFEIVVLYVFGVCSLIYCLKICSMSGKKIKSLYMANLDFFCV